MNTPLDKLRLEAKVMQRAWSAREAWALDRVRQYLPGKSGDLARADFLHVVAQQHGFASWPRLKAEAENIGFDRAQQVQQLKIALAHGRNERVAELLTGTPDLADGVFGLECALYRREAVAAVLAQDPERARKQCGPRTPIQHLAFSTWIHAQPQLQADMLALADLLHSLGADLDAVDGQGLSPLYGAIGRGNNMVLGQWLLDHGANPNDGDTLYHATELGHHAGLRMLLAAGARPEGTNALFRAMDFHDHQAVALLIAHQSSALGIDSHAVGGSDAMAIHALHHAARRGCDARMVEMLLEGGADPMRRYQGAYPYAFARVYGNKALAAALTARGATVDLSREEALMVRAAEGAASPGEYIDPGKLPAAYRMILPDIMLLPGRLSQMQRLVALGLPYDAPDGQGVTPLQLAGWQGLPEVMTFFIQLRADLSHINGHGGTLLTTILHGAENCPDRAGRDHQGCLELALKAGVALPRHVIRQIGRSDLRAFLADWAAAHPGQVV